MPATRSLVLVLLVMLGFTGAVACGREGTNVQQKRCPDGTYRPLNEPCPTTTSGSEQPVSPGRKGWSRVGCSVHGCSPPQYCNDDTGFCELLPCDSDRDCKYGYQCDFERRVCQ